MRFRQWLNLDKPYYHGTANGDEIRQHGFKVSLSGFGQRSLRGVALSPEKTDAIRYARAHLHSRDGTKPEILACLAHLQNPIDLRGCQLSYDIWVKLGYNPFDNPNDREMIHRGNENNPFFLTDFLIQQGYDGAVVDNTLDLDGPYELCVFDPKKIEIVQSISL